MVSTEIFVFLSGLEAKCLYIVQEWGKDIAKLQNPSKNFASNKELAPRRLLLDIEEYVHRFILDDVK
jgi:hypothetical protein